LIKFVLLNQFLPCFVVILRNDGLSRQELRFSGADIDAFAGAIFGEPLEPTESLAGTRPKELRKANTIRTM